MRDEIRIGEKLFLDGEVDRAEEWFLGLLNKNERDSDSLCNLGVIACSRGDMERAERYFSRAFDIDGEHTDSIMNLAQLHLAREQWEAAAGMLERRLSLDTPSPRALELLATAYERLGKLHSAGELLRAVLSLDASREDIKARLDGLFPPPEVALPEPNSFRASFIQLDITPPVSPDKPIPLQGMAGPARPATVVSDPLLMQLFLVEDDHHTRVLWISADIFGFGTEIVEHVRRVAADWSIQPEGLILNASHTHSGPGTVAGISQTLGPFQPEYAGVLIQSIGRALPLLFDSLEEADLSWGSVRAGIGMSRRLPRGEKIAFAPNPGGFYDQHTPYLLARLKKSDKRVLLVNHGCHPTVLGAENVISADYPGCLRQALLEKGTADAVMFLQGGAGSTKGTMAADDRVRFAAGAEDARSLGERLADAVHAGVNKGTEPLTGNFVCARREVSLPGRPLPPAQQLAHLRDDANIPIVVREWAAAMLQRYPVGNNPPTHRCEVQFVSVGGRVSFVGVSGEPVAELARDIRECTPNPEATFVLGYTNGLLGYLPTDSMIREGGYEADSSFYYYLLPSPVGSGSEAAITGAVKESVSAAAASPGKLYGGYTSRKEDCRAFFVLSAGRCGTKTLTALLDIATNARVWHHPQPFLINETLQAYRNTIDKRKVFWQARYPFLRRTWAEGLIHGETDHNMTPFCDVVAQDVPDSKFVVLVRNPMEFVRSGMRRNYYVGHSWDTGRLRPEEDTEEGERFRSLDQFGKICWLWRETYSRILIITKTIPADRVLLVRFEELVEGTSKAGEIFSSLGLQGFDEAKVMQVLGQKLNAQVGGVDFPKPSQWPAELTEQLMRECGQLYRLFYPQGHECWKKRPKAEPVTPPAPPAPSAKGGGFASEGLRLSKPSAAASPSPTGGGLRIGAVPGKARTETMEPAPRQGTPPGISSAGRTPAVSIGFTVYNGGEATAKAVESILQQCFDDFELIISDNGSTDDTEERCRAYERADGRVRYERQAKNLGIIRNMNYVLGAARGEYFMWIQHDNWHEPDHLAACVRRFEEDDGTTALVYPRANVYRNGRCHGVANDRLNADMDDPGTRYGNVIRELGMCNALLGLYRRKFLVRSTAFYADLYRSHDHLLLAEMALTGKIVQIGDVLFNRGLTRNYDLPEEERYADLIESIDPAKMLDGVTMPLCRLAYAHLQLVSRSELDPERKDRLMKETLHCFRNRFGGRMLNELQRAVTLVREGRILHTWNRGDLGEGGETKLSTYVTFHANELLQRFGEVSFLFPEEPGIRKVCDECREILRAGTSFHAPAFMPGEAAAS